MSTAAQLAANLAIAQASTGPKSEEGKKRSSLKCSENRTHWPPSSSLIWEFREHAPQSANVYRIRRARNSPSSFHVLASGCNDSPVQ